MSDHLEHPSDLPASPFLQYDLQPGVAFSRTAGRPDAHDLGRPRPPAIQEDAAPELRELYFRRNARDLHLVFLGATGRRMRHEAGDVSIVRQEEESLGLDVETPDRLDAASEAGRQQVEHCVAAFGVVGRRDVSLRLVQQHVRPGTGPDRDPFPIHPDRVRLRVLAVSQGRGTAVDPDAPFADPFFRLSPRSEPSLGDQLLNPYGGQAYGSSSSASSAAASDSADAGEDSPVVPVDEVSPSPSIVAARSSSSSSGFGRSSNSFNPKRTRKSRVVR